MNGLGYRCFTLGDFWCQRGRAIEADRAWMPVEQRMLRAMLQMHGNQPPAIEVPGPDHLGHCEICGVPVDKRSRRCMTHREPLPARLERIPQDH